MLPPDRTAALDRVYKKSHTNEHVCTRLGACAPAVVRAIPFRPLLQQRKLGEVEERNKKWCSLVVPTGGRPFELTHRGRLAGVSTIMSLSESSERNWRWTIEGEVGSNKQGERRHAGLRGMHGSDRGEADLAISRVGICGREAQNGRWRGGEVG